MADEEPSEEKAPARTSSSAELRRLRRWLVVAIVWAMAGSAVGVIALIEERNRNDEEARTTASGLAKLQRSLNGRIDSLEKKLDAQDKRINSLEGSLEEAKSSADLAASARESVQALTERVQDLEDAKEK